ncbi:MAG: ABC transporter ATP-binding protein [Paraglaciecola sp.]|uniref:ABC transporter ATP-binding protein n=1 Tax=Paraglaciecola sp. TaxID=1920173 RepID=UPI0032980900
MLSLENISHRFANHSLFSNITLQITEPRILITGSNGSGKTTLLMIAAGLISPTSGTANFNGQAVKRLDVKKQIGISANKIVLPEFYTVREFLQFHCEQFGCALDEYWLHAFGLDVFLQTKVSDLSLGNHKKLSLLTAILHKPKLLLLDEPTNGLDTQARTALDSLFKGYTGQIIIASHDVIRDANYFERHINLNDETTEQV